MRNLDIGTASSQGRSVGRKINEDALGYQRRLSQNGPVDLVVVCDGLGGMDKGNVASSAAVDFLLRDQPCPSFRSKADFSNWLVSEIEMANEVVIRELKGSSGGTTCTAAAFTRDVMILGHVGDSRAYLASGKTVKCITTDHSVAAALKAAGQLSPGVNRPTGLLRALGSHKETPHGFISDLSASQVVAEKSWTTFGPGEIVLICSDGVWDPIDDDLLVETLLTPGQTAQGIADRLIQLAIQCGGDDDASAVVVRNTSPNPRKARNWLDSRISLDKTAVVDPSAVPLARTQFRTPSDAGVVSQVAKMDSAQRTVRSADRMASKQVPSPTVATNHHEVSTEVSATPKLSTDSWRDSARARIALSILAGLIVAGGAFKILQVATKTDPGLGQAISQNDTVENAFLTRKYWGRSVEVAKNELGTPTNTFDSQQVVVAQVRQRRDGTLSLEAFTVAQARQIVDTFLTAGSSFDQIKKEISETFPALEVTGPPDSSSQEAAAKASVTFDGNTLVVALS